MIGRCGLILLLISAACAQPEAPPGGPEDRVPPVVIETTPDTFAVVEPGVREFVFRFNERVSERPSNGDLDRAVVISPSLGGARVRHGRDGISVEAEEGLVADRLYRVTVLPVINDMFGNTLRDPFDLVLSTGGEFVPNVVAGMVEDRITGQAVPDARVEARFGGEGDTLTHWNLSGSDGVFSMRYVPGAPFEVIAWEDRNRDGALDDSEPQSALSGGAFDGSPDTTFTILTLIEPDTTPARLARVEVQDSVTLSLEFDDYLDPDMRGVFIAGRLVLARLIDSAAVAAADGEEAQATEDAPGDEAAAREPPAAEAAEEPGDTAAAVGDQPGAEGADSAQVAFADTVTVPPGKDTIAIRFYHAHEYELRNREVADSIARAERQALVDSLAELGEPAPPQEEDADTATAPLGPVGLSGQLLPAQTLMGVLDEALVRGAPYEASVSGVVNIAGVQAGGGTAEALWELPPPDTATADSAAVADSLAVGDSAQAGDSVQAVDTTGAGPDTTQAVPDTAQVRPDTTQAPPDTTDTARARPDTARVGPDPPIARLHAPSGPHAAGAAPKPPPFVRAPRVRAIPSPRGRARR